MFRGPITRLIQSLTLATLSYVAFTNDKMEKGQTWSHYKRVTHILNWLGQHQPCSFLLLYVIDISFGYVVMSLSLRARHGGSSVWGVLRSNPLENFLCVNMMSGVNAVSCGAVVFTALEFRQPLFIIGLVGASH